MADLRLVNAIKEYLYSDIPCLNRDELPPHKLAQEELREYIERTTKPIEGKSNV